MAHSVWTALLFGLLTIFLMLIGKNNKLGRTHEKQWIRRSESTSAKREWIWIYESTAFECVLRLNTPQTNRHFFMIGCLVVYIF